LPPIQCHESDKKIQMIQLTDDFYCLFLYMTSNLWLQYATDSVIRDPIETAGTEVEVTKNGLWSDHVIEELK